MPWWEYWGPNYSQERLICEGDIYYRSLAQAIMGVLQNVRVWFGRWILSYIIGETEDILANNGIWKQNF